MNILGLFLSHICLSSSLYAALVTEFLYFPLLICTRPGFSSYTEIYSPKIKKNLILFSVAVENVIVISMKLCVFQTVIIGAILWSQTSHLFDLCGSTSVQSVEGNADD